MPSYKEKNSSRKNPWHSSFYYEDWQGKKQHKHKSGFPRKKDADKYEKEFLNKYAKSPNILLKNLMDNYFVDMKKQKLGITTLKSKRGRMEDKVLPFFGEWKLNEIEPIDITNWQNWVKDQGYEKFGEEGYKDTYLRTIHNDLNSLLNYAVRLYNLQVNPCLIAGAMGNSTADEMNIWTLDEYEHWITYEDKLATKIAFDILYWSGCREGECLALTPADLLPNRSISINKNFATVDNVEYYLPTKNKRNRIVSIPGFLYEEIMQYIGLMYGLKQDDRIFYFTASHLQKEMKRVSELACMDSIRVHDLRHSHVALLIAMGYNILIVSERLGHKSVKVTLDTYGHLYPGDAEKVAFGLQEAKFQGITANPTAEAQVLSLLQEIKKTLPSITPHENDGIIFYNPVDHTKYQLTQKQFEEEMSENGLNPKLQFAEMMYQGYLELNEKAVYCFASRGMPVKYL